MSPLTYCAATALLLCQPSAAFMSLPAQEQGGSQKVPGGNVLSAKTTRTITTTTPPSSTLSTRPSAERKGLRTTELAAAEGRSSEGDVPMASGGAGASPKVAEATRSPPRSVLERPWDVEVDFHGERRVITVQPGDSILEAAEMSGMNLSYECRRGNCISCAARVQEGSSGHYENRADRQEEDGAPGGFVLTCSTHPTGPGVKLDLSANAEMWEAYGARFEDISMQDLFRKTSAGIMRKYRVEHPDFFREEVERQFNES